MAKLSRFLLRYTDTATRAINTSANMRNSSHAVLGHFLQMSPFLQTATPCNKVRRSPAAPQTIRDIDQTPHTTIILDTKTKHNLENQHSNSSRQNQSPNVHTHPPTHLYAPVAQSPHSGPVYRLEHVPLGPPRHASAGSHGTNSVADSG